MVINIDSNTPCTYSKSFVRNFVTALFNIIPLVGWLIEPIIIISSTDGRKLGDKAANTKVIDVQHFKNL